MYTSLQLSCDSPYSLGVAVVLVVGFDSSSPNSMSELGSETWEYSWGEVVFVCMLILINGRLKDPWSIIEVPASS